MLKTGIDIRYPVEQFGEEKSGLFNIGEGLLIVCLAKEIEFSMIDEIMKSSNENTRIIFSENGFKSDSIKINILNKLDEKGLKQVLSV